MCKDLISEFGLCDDNCCLDSQISRFSFFTGSQAIEVSSTRNPVRIWRHFVIKQRSLA